MSYRQRAETEMRDHQRNSMVKAELGTTMTEGMHQKSIRQRRGPTIKFTGQLIAMSEFEMRNGQEMRLEIWETEGGSLIPVSVTADETRAGVIAPADEMAMRFGVMDFFDWQDRARTMVKDQLKWRLHLVVL